jgi:DNA-binding transcriptional LysR family regulator
MNLQQLRHFVTLAEAGSFRKAAERLHMTQPPLSVSIRRLEEDLGVVLFSRDVGGVRLTAAGTSVLEQARSALFYLQQIRDVARAVTGGEGGCLRVGFIGSATFALLPRMLPVYLQRFPRVRLELQESTTEEILALVNDRVLDVGLIRYPVYRASEATIEQVEFDRLAVALPMSHPLCDLDPVPLGALAREPFILYSRAAVPNLHALVIELCQEAGYFPHVVQEAVQIQTILSLVESGLGVALVPSLAARYSSGRIALRPLAGVLRPASTGIALAYRPDLETAIGRRFREMVKEFAAPECDTGSISRNAKTILDE